MNSKFIFFKCMALSILFNICPALAMNNSNTWQDTYTLENNGKYAQAEAVLDAILRDSPNHEFALMRRAWMRYKQGHYNEAIRDYNLLISINPKSQDARLGMTLPLMAQHRWKEAEMEAYTVIAASAWDYTAHVRILICEEAMQNWPALAVHASALAVRYPTDATALVYLARAYARQGNIQYAKLVYLKVLERIPGHLEANAYLKNNL